LIRKGLAARGKQKDLLATPDRQQQCLVGGIDDADNARAAENEHALSKRNFAMQFYFLGGKVTNFTGARILKFCGCTYSFPAHVM
jgi:hypothetical protein